MMDNDRGYYSRHQERRGNRRHQRGGNWPRRGGHTGYHDPREAKIKDIKRLITKVAEPRRVSSTERLEAVVVDLSNSLLRKGFLEGGEDTKELAKILVQVAGTLSMRTSEYAVLVALLAHLGKRTSDSDPNSGVSTGGVETSGSGNVDPGGSRNSLEAHDIVDQGPSFGRLVVDGTCTSFTTALQMGAFLKAKLLLRFLGELVNCGLVQAQEYGDMLTTLCTGYMTCADISIKQPCKDMVADILLSSVLWTGATLSKGWTGGFSDLLDGARNYMGQRTPPFHQSGMRAIFHSSDDFNTEECDEDEMYDDGDGVRLSGRSTKKEEPVTDSLALLWDVISSLHDNNWLDDEHPEAITKLWKTSLIQEKLVNIHSVSLPEDAVTAETIPVELKRMGPFEMASGSKFGNCAATSPSDRLDWSFCLGVMGEWSLFQSEGGEGPRSCCPEILPKHEHVVLRGYCKDTLVCFQPNCEQDGTKVGQWALLVDQLLGVGAMAPVTCQAVYLVMEVLFLIILQVSIPKTISMVCQRVILELCRAAPKEAPGALTYCTATLFEELERMDTLVVSRFEHWFADHLKNTQYKWPFWNNWSEVVEASPDNAQRAFVTNVLAAIVKLSYVERIKKTLPEGFWSLLPPPPSTVCPYLDGGDSGSHGLSRVAADLLGKVKRRESSASVSSWLDSEQGLRKNEGEGGDAEEMGEPGASWRATILVQVLLRLGQVSPTHTFVLLDKYRDYLRALSDDGTDGRDNQMAMLEGVAELWQHSPNWFCLVCRHLLRLGVVSPANVIRYFFKEDSINMIAYTPSLWEILHCAISLCLEHVAQALLALDEAKNVEDLDEAAKSGTTIAGEDGAGETIHAVQSARDEESTGLKAQVEAMDGQEGEGESSFEESVITAREALEDARAVCMEMGTLAIQALGSAIKQYNTNAINPFEDPWWVSITSYFKGALREFCTLPPVPVSVVASIEGLEGKLRIVDPEELAKTAAAEGCSEHVEGILDDLSQL
ncbi:unnamed protein product [Discosporangium mesarthrocarpum]